MTAGTSASPFSYVRVPLQGTQPLVGEDQNLFQLNPSEAQKTFAGRDVFPISPQLISGSPYLSALIMDSVEASDPSFLGESEAKVKAYAFRVLDAAGEADHLVVKVHNSVVQKLQAIEKHLKASEAKGGLVALLSNPNFLQDCNYLQIPILGEALARANSEEFSELLMLLEKALTETSSNTEFNKIALFSKESLLSMISSEQLVQIFSNATSEPKTFKRFFSIFGNPQVSNAAVGAAPRALLAQITDRISASELYKGFKLLLSNSEDMKLFMQIFEGRIVDLAGQASVPTLKNLILQVYAPELADAELNLSSFNVAGELEHFVFAGDLQELQLVLSLLSYPSLNLLSQLDPYMAYVRLFEAMSEINSPEAVELLVKAYGPDLLGQMEEGNISNLFGSCRNPTTLKVLLKHFGAEGVNKLNAVEDSHVVRMIEVSAADAEAMAAILTHFGDQISELTEDEKVSALKHSMSHLDSFQKILKAFGPPPSGDDSLKAISDKNLSEKLFATAAVSTPEVFNLFLSVFHDRLDKIAPRDLGFIFGQDIEPSLMHFLAEKFPLQITQINPHQLGVAASRKTSSAEKITAFLDLFGSKGANRIISIEADWVHLLSTHGSELPEEAKAYFFEELSKNPHYIEEAQAHFQIHSAIMNNISE